MGCACPSPGMSAVCYLPVQNVQSTSTTNIIHTCSTTDTCPHITAGWHSPNPKTHSPPFGPVWMDSPSSLACTVMLSVLALHLVECYSSTQVSAGMITKANAYLYHCHCHSSTVNGFQLYLPHNSILMIVRKTRILIFNVM